MAPFLVEPGVVVLRVVADHHDAPAAPRAAPEELVRNSGEGDIVEHPLRPSIDQPPVTKSNRTPIAHRLVGLGVEEDGFPNPGENPHPAPWPMLLEVDLVHGP